MCKKIISLIVILAFLYSSFVWADPQLGTVNNSAGRETLAYDANGFLGHLNHASRGDITIAWALGEKSPEVFNQIRSRLEEGEISVDFQSILVEILFTMFGDTLGGLKRSDVTGLSASGEGIVLHAGSGEYVLSMQGDGDEEKFILKMPSKTRSEEGFSILPVILMIVFSILYVVLLLAGCTVENRIPEVDGGYNDSGIMYDREIPDKNPKADARTDRISTPDKSIKSDTTTADKPKTPDMPIVDKPKMPDKGTSDKAPIPDKTPKPDKPVTLDKAVPDISKPDKIPSPDKSLPDKSKPDITPKPDKKPVADTMPPDTVGLPYPKAYIEAGTNTQVVSPNCFSGSD